MPGVTGRQAAFAAGAGSLAAARVMVAESGDAERGLLVRLLHRLGIPHVEQAASGAEVLAGLDRASFDLVLLDVGLPDEAVFGVLERMRRAGLAGRTPVVAVAAAADMEAVARCVSLGAEDYLFKPVDPVLLHARIMSSFERRRLRDRTRDVLAARAAELAQARTLQQALVPPPLRTSRLVVDLLLEPAREIGGDLVDHFPIVGGSLEPNFEHSPGGVPRVRSGASPAGGSSAGSGAGSSPGSGLGLHAVLVGDVSDKGAAAALVMARAHALLHGLLIRPDAAEVLSDPAGALSVLNAALTARNDGTMFATALLAVLDLATGRLRYCRAGHVPPWLRRADGTQLRLDALGGVPLGIVEDAEYASSDVVLGPGDVLLALSDGVTEAEAPDGAQFGDAGVERCLDLCRGREDQLLPTLLAQVRAHEAGRPAGDDVAALVLRIPGPGGSMGGASGGTGAAGETLGPPPRPSASPAPA